MEDQAQPQGLGFEAARAERAGLTRLLRRQYARAVACCLEVGKWGGVIAGFGSRHNGR